MLWIVKLGGSLAAGADLLAWLETISRYGGGRCVVVPGGGSFADAVRLAQQQWHFGDDIAHHMALLAMVQYGLMLSALVPGLQAAASRDEISSALRARRVAVWLPVPMALADASIETSWRVTSDSLALWLAERLNAARLVLVKSIPVRVNCVQRLVANGIVDALFADYAGRSRCEIFCLGPGEAECLARALRDGIRPSHPLGR